MSSFLLFFFFLFSLTPKHKSNQCSYSAIETAHGTSAPCHAGSCYFCAQKGRSNVAGWEVMEVQGLPDCPAEFSSFTIYRTVILALKPIQVCWMWDNASIITHPITESLKFKKTSEIIEPALITTLSSRQWH